MFHDEQEVGSVSEVRLPTGKTQWRISKPAIENQFLRRHAERPFDAPRRHVYQNAVVDFAPGSLEQRNGIGIEKTYA